MMAITTSNSTSVKPLGCKSFLDVFMVMTDLSASFCLLGYTMMLLGNYALRTIVDYSLAWTERAPAC